MKSRQGLGVLAELTKALGKLANNNGNGKTPSAEEKADIEGGD